MGPPKTAAFLKNLTRLGARQAYLLCDNAFAGSDTLATAYTLSLAIGKLQPDLILCGRQTVDGDTGQVGPELAVLAGYPLISNVMEMKVGEHLACRNREGVEIESEYPVLCSVERIHTLRLPSIRSKKGEVVIWNATDLGADASRCGLAGSPTKVIKTFENNQDRRVCKFITKEELPTVMADALQKARASYAPVNIAGNTLSRVWIVGEDPRSMAETISKDITMIALDTPRTMAEQIKQGRPEVILWGSDS